METVPTLQPRESQLQLSRVTSRGGAAAVSAARRRGATMGSRVAMGKVKQAVYPLFLELARACVDTDTFWQKFFESMASGRFPKGVILRDDCLVHRTRKKVTTFELSRDALKDWQNLAEFFRTTCDIRSERDWELRRMSGEVVVQLTTAQINKRVKKEHANAIPEFTLLLKSRYQLTPSEMSEVDVLLKYYSTSNLFRPGDVVYGVSGAIREIKTLAFDEETRRFSITAEAKAPRYATKESYQDVTSYLTNPPFTKSMERKIGFDDELKKHLRQLYAPQIAAREKEGKPVLPNRRRGKTTVVEEEVVIEEDDIDVAVEIPDEVHRRRRSDDDSA